MKINNKFIVIQDWMWTSYKLKGTELLLYALIYGFSQDGDGKFYGSLSYIEKFFGISRKTAIASIKRLINKGLIKRSSESHYYVVLPSGEITPLLVEKLHYPSGETTPNNNNTNNNYNNNTNTSKSKICKEVKQSNSVNDLMGLFYDNLNPNIKFENKTIRKDAEFLVSHYPFEKLEAMVMYIKDHKNEQYFPSISTPSQLREKMSAIINHYNRSKVNTSKLIKI